MPRVRVNLTAGDHVGSCVYVNEAGFSLTKKGFKNRICTFKCKCGAEFNAHLGNVQKGNTTSCGCHKIGMIGSCNLKHGLSRISNKRETGYTCYQKMVARCTNPNNPQYNKYSKRGVCQRWIDSFENFTEDMGIRPSLKHSVERVDNKKGYSKENCKWATKIEQANNTSTNLLVCYRGQTKTFAQWCSLLDIKYTSSYLRYTRYNKPFSLVVAMGIVDRFKNKVILKVA